jgi:DNA-binding NtrC family response regulator
MSEETSSRRSEAVAARSVDLLRAVTRALEVLGSAGDETAALTESFDGAARAFGAEKALLLGVRGTEPVDLVAIRVLGLDADAVDACVRGESIAGVSASRIRRAIESREAQLVENSQFEDRRPDETGSLRGRPHSVLCAPVADPWTQTVRAVVYFQTTPGPQGYTAEDLPYARAYAVTLGHAFGLFLAGQRRYRALEEDWRRLARERETAAPEIIGDSEDMQRLRADLADIFLPATETPTPRPILILGPTGSGKDLVARYLHYYSEARGRGPFIEHNCAGLTGDLVQSTLFGHVRGAFTGATDAKPGLFRAAHKGVLFLDEIGAMPSTGQELLLKVLDRWVVQAVGDTRAQPVDVLLLCATNLDLAGLVREGRFRNDLYQRLKTLSIRLKPLAERPGDVLPLVVHFLAEAEKKLQKRTRGLAPEALHALLTYAWPGNIRELAGVCTALVTHARAGATLDAEAVKRACPEILDPARHGDTRFAEELIGGPFYEARARFERDFILHRLEIQSWNVPEAARSMGLSTATLYRYLQRLGVRRGEDGA